MIQLIRIHLEHQDDVIRDIEIPSDLSLEDLHLAIIDHLDLEKKQIASFYITNDKFELLQEIPLLKFDDKDNEMLSMNEIMISSIFQKEGSQLLYVYDFLKMWQFSITYLKKSEINSSKIRCINKIGKMPSKAPEIQFESNSEFDPFNEAFHEFNDFE